MPSWWCQILVTSRKPFVKWMLNGIELPLHQNLIYWPSLTASLEQYLRAIWGAASQAAVVILPQIKLNSQLSSCFSFLVDSEQSELGLCNNCWSNIVCKSVIFRLKVVTYWEKKRKKPTNDQVSLRNSSTNKVLNFSGKVSQRPNTFTFPTDVWDEDIHFLQYIQLQSAWGTASAEFYWRSSSYIA